MSYIIIKFGSVSVAKIADQLISKQSEVYSKLQKEIVSEESDYTEDYEEDD